MNADRDGSKRSRLLAAAEMVPAGSRVADIGSGHGLLPQMLLETGRASHCIAGERTPETLALVRPIPSHLPLAACLELRAGDGLTILEPDDRIDVVVMLGMGTRTIEHILDAPVVSSLAVSRFIFQSQTDSAELRRGLLSRGLAIREERLVRDRGRIYLLIAAEPSADPAIPAHPTLSSADLLEVGPLLVGSGDPLALEVWRKELRRRQGIAEQAGAGSEGGGSSAAGAALDQARRIVAALEAHSG